MFRKPNNVKPEEKGHDFLMATWNVKGLKEVGALNNLKSIMQKNKLGILVVQEMGWKGEGIMRSGDFTVFYKGGQRYLFGTGFIVNNIWKNAILNFTGFNERIATLRLKAKFFNITLINIHAPTEVKDNEVKEEFYDNLDAVYNGVPDNDVKIVLGDSNAKVGRELYHHKVAGKYSLHEFSNDNGTRLIEFAKDRSMHIKSTMFPHKDIYKQIWVSPDGQTINQIDHVLIEKRHASDILDVKSRRGVDCNSDHFLVQIKYRQKMAKERHVEGRKRIKYDVEKLKKQETVEVYQQVMENNLKEDPKENIEEQWAKLKSAVTNTADCVLGKMETVKGKEWFDELCERVIRERNVARMNWLQKKTRLSMENYRQMRREAKIVCRKKKESITKI